MARRSRLALAAALVLAALLGGMLALLLWFDDDVTSRASAARTGVGSLERRDTSKDDLAAAQRNTREATPRATSSDTAHTPPSDTTRTPPEAPVADAPTMLRAIDFVGSIEGTLTFAGVPAADWIVVARECPSGEARHVARSDTHGRFTITSLAPARYTLVVEGPNDPDASALSPWLRPLQRTLADVSAGAVTHVDIELGGGTTVVRGRVVDQFGKPAAGLHVRLRGVDAFAAYDFVDVGPRESFGNVRLNITSLRNGTRNADTDPCSMGVAFVDVTTSVDERGDFVFEGLPPRLYCAEVQEQSERTIPQLDGYVAEFKRARYLRYCDTSLLADWDTGDLGVVRRIPFDVVVKFVDTAGVAIDRQHPFAKAWCVAGNSMEQYGVPVGDGRQRIHFVNDTSLGSELQTHTYAVEVSIAEVPVASTSFLLSDVLALPLVEGKRVHEITLTLP